MIDDVPIEKIGHIRGVADRLSSVGRINTLRDRLQDALRVAASLFGSDRAVHAQEKPPRSTVIVPVLHKIGFAAGRVHADAEAAQICIKPRVVLIAHKAYLLDCVDAPPYPHVRKSGGGKETQCSFVELLACCSAWPSLRWNGYMLRQGRYILLDTLRPATALPVRGL